ncbi:MAG: ankyrin repeat domain-containing protein [Brevinematales bacterium]
MYRYVLILLLPFIQVGFSYGDANKELLLAISQKNFEAVQHAIENKKASVSYRDINKRTPLHWAVIAGDLKIVAYLLYKGADIEAREKNGATPLHFAAYSKNLDIVKYLIQQNANINATDYSGWTPLHYYTYYQFEMGVKYLIYANADLDVKTTKPSMGIPAGATALDIALKINKQTYIEALSNPQTYQNIANRPKLTLHVQPVLSFSNILLAEEKGTFVFTVKNEGQGMASSTILEFSGLTNGWVSFNTNLPPQMVGMGSSASWQSEVLAFSPPTDGETFFRVRAVDMDSRRASEWKTVSFRIWSNRPPSLILEATLLGTTNVLRPLMQTTLLLTISNEGFGPLKNALFSIRDTKGYIFPLTIPHIFLPRQSSTNLLLSLTTTQNVEDGETTLEMVVSSPSLLHLLVFSKPLPTKGYEPAQLSCSPHLYKRLVFTILTNTITQTNGDSFESITTNSFLAVYPMFELFNKGEQSATNLSVEIRIPTETNIFIYTYKIPWLAPQEKRNLVIPLERHILSTENIFLLITDGLRNYLSTNIPVSIWPGE